MARKYTKIETLTSEIYKRKEAGESHREIADHFGVTKEQIKSLVNRENRKRRKILSGYIPKPKGRPRKVAMDEEARRQQETRELRMQVELLRNFLSEVGRR